MSGFREKRTLRGPTKSSSPTSPRLSSTQVELPGLVKRRGDETDADGCSSAPAPPNHQWV